MMSTVYLVVTVAVNRRQVGIPVIAVIAIEMMGFDQRFRRENESTSYASSVLSLQQLSHSVRDARISSPAHRPVTPVAIVWTGAVFDFNMPHNRYAGMLIELQSIDGGKHPALAGMDSPIPMGYPMP